MGSVKKMDIQAGSRWLLGALEDNIQHEFQQKFTLVKDSQAGTYDEFY